MYAVVSSGGKQYRVEPGSTLIVERLTADAGATITFDRVLLVGDGETISVGTPTVSGASVSGTVIGEELGPKLVIFKYKQKVKYRRRTGHRQHHTRVRIDGITANGRTESAPEEEKAAKAKAPKAAKAKAAKAKAPKAKVKAPAKRASSAASSEKKTAAPKRRAPAAKKASAAKTKAKADTDKAPAKRASTRRKPAAKKSEPKE